MQDDDHAFPRNDENRNINPKASMPKDKHKKWLSWWSEIAGVGMKALGLKGVFTLHCFRRGGDQHQLMIAKFCDCVC